MVNNLVNSLTRSNATRVLFLVSIIFNTYNLSTAQELLSGFKANPSPSVSSFQPLLTDSTGNFSLGFYRVNKSDLSLIVTHLPSLEPLWQVAADPTTTTSRFRWSDKTHLFFNGSLVLSDPHTGSIWSSGNQQGDKLVLLNTSNLQILQNDNHVVWQSFDFPTNTLVQNQNFTSNMSLVSSNGLYSLRLGDDFMALYANFKENPEQPQMYWKYKALEAKAKVVPGHGPIHARVESDGFLAMYQTGTTPVDIQSFNSYHRPIDRFLLVRLEPDGNLKAYYWVQDSGTNTTTSWVLDYQAISDTCELPRPCGSYGICKPGSGCSCLDNTTDIGSNDHKCIADDHDLSGDFCNENGDFRVLRRKGVELPFKELMGSDTVSSLEKCEQSCEANCTCWGVVYNNATKFCYHVDYPIQTVLGVGDETKVGYFKVKEGKKNKKTKVGFGVGIGILTAVILVVVGGIGFGGCKIWNRRRLGVRRILEESEVSPGPYKDLGSASFKSIEMVGR